MIVTLTLNPALDKSIQVEQLVAEKKMRCQPLQMEAGGGGINVSKAIKELGGQSLAVFPSGGMEGRRIEELLVESGIEIQPTAIAHASRESFNVTELSTGKQYKFIMPGPALQENEIKSLLTKLQQVKEISFFVVSGSMPPGLTEDHFAEIMKIARDKKARLIVDTSGPFLKKALEAGVFLLKPNLTELCFLAGKEYLEINEIEAAAHSIINQGLCENMVVSMGPSGAMLITQRRSLHIPAPAVKKISTVGAGDSMMAGIIWMLERGAGIEDAVKFGIACGTAATVDTGQGLFKAKQAHLFFDWIRSQAR